MDPSEHKQLAEECYGTSCTQNTNNINFKNCLVSYTFKIIVFCELARMSQ